MKKHDDKQNKRRKAPLRYPDHKPVTRRQFLAQGFIGVSASLTLPGAAGLGMTQAYLESCGAVDLPDNFLPFMVFDMAGGAALPANFLVGGQGGAEDLLASYDLLGWDPRAEAAVDAQFGLPMATVGGLYQGIVQNTSPEARANLRMGSLCHTALDDTSSNRLNANSLVLLAGTRGQFLANGIGLRGSSSGGNSRAVIEEAALKPVQMNRIGDLAQSTSFGGPAFANTGMSFLRALASGGVGLSRAQVRDMVSAPGGDVLAELSRCAYERSLQFVEGVSGLDPREDAVAQGIYGINANTAETDENALSAAVAMNAIKGFSGPGTWTLGGCDYHDGTATTGDAKDLDMGVQIGRAVEFAHQSGRPFFFQLLTDGGCSNTRGTRIWRGDSGDKCMTVMGFYNPRGPAEMRRNQVGYYNSAQAAEPGTLIGGDVTLAAYAVLANYLNCAGRLAEFGEVAPGIFTGAGELESVLVFERPAV